jgi:hypothetical protein
MKMMKNTVKVMMAITLTTVVGTSFFIEPVAAAKRVGNPYSTAGGNGYQIDQQFNLVDTTQDGQPIQPITEYKDNGFYSIFTGAIENYQYGIGKVCISGDTDPKCANGHPAPPPNGYYIVDDFGNFIFTIPFTSPTSPVNGDLKAQYYPGGTDPLFGDGGNPGYDVIAYSIFKEGESEPALNFRLPVDALLNLEPSQSPDTMIEQAVNNLEFILDNNLLGLKSTFVANPVPDPANPGYNTSGLGRAILQKQQDIPEPDTKVGILGVLGIVSAGVLLKRKAQQR